MGLKSDAFHVFEAFSVTVISWLIVYRVVSAPVNLQPLPSHALHRRTTNHRPGSLDLLSSHSVSYKKAVFNNGYNKIL